MYDIDIRASIEFVSAAICLILLWFMVKPYRLTRESRYIALPLGFGFLGISYVFSGITMALPGFSTGGSAWMQLFPRAFAFIFLAITYFFSKEPSGKSRFTWNLAISSLIIALVASLALAIALPQFVSGNYRAASTYVRILNLICLSYISIYTLRSHVKSPSPTTIWIPLGYILLGVSQYLLLVWAVDDSLFSFWSALVLRLVALSVFLIVTYLTFYGMGKRVK